MMIRAFADKDLIAAIATSRGSAGVGIVRVSGKDSDIQRIARTILGVLPKPRYAHYTSFYDSNKKAMDEGIALYFREPHSFTGESVLELQAHGGAFVLDSLLAEVLRQGARMANPGEFSFRAFSNGKLDLIQAEAVSDLIQAGTEVAARSALRSLQGEFSSQVNELLQHLIELRRYVEAAIDFSEEEIDFLGQGQVIEKLERLQKSVSILLKGAQQGSLLQQGATLAIVGEPNVGKSSLLNRLTATDTAIVTEIAGTTRDVLRERIQIDGLPIQLVDTAGIRETTDFIEQAGIVRSWKEIEQADCILWVFDLSTEQYPQKSRIYREILKKTHGKTPVVAVGNKLDEAPHWDVDNLGVNEGVVALSAKTGQGVDQLREKIKALVGFQSIHESPFIARRRHVIALERVFGALNAATVQAKARLTDCLAEELRYAQTALAELTGEITPDDLLGEIFSNFCVGK